MSTFPWLTVAGAIPLVGAVVIAVDPRPVGARQRRPTARP